MEEAQPLPPRNDDEIIKQPANDAAENLPPSNSLSSSVLGIIPAGIESGKNNSFLFAENKMSLNKWFNELAVYQRVMLRHQNFLA